MGISFLHTADWQLGKPFNQFGPEAGPLLRRARLEAVRKIARLAIRYAVDAVLVAGDVFDQQLVSPEVVTACLGAMAEFNGDWVLLPGNHDAAVEGSVWDKVRSRLPRGNRIHLATTSQPILLTQGGMAVLPAPLTRRHETSDITSNWDNLATPPLAIRVGLAHGSVQGVLPEAAESANPVASDRGVRARLAYLALGDWHGLYQVGSRTWYSGTPEPDSFKQNSSGSVLRVHFSDREAEPTVEPIETADYTWLAFSRSIQSCGDWDQLDHELEQTQPARHHVVKLQLQGSLPVADWQTVQERLLWWAGQFAALRVEQEDLGTVTTQDDFARLRPPGYVGEAAAALLCRQNEGDVRAGAALRILYRICSQVEAPL